MPARTPELKVGPIDKPRQSSSGLPSAPNPWLISVHSFVPSDVETVKFVPLSSSRL